MKKKSLLTTILLAFVDLLSFGLSGCKAKHEAEIKWSYDSQEHWHNCRACDDEQFDRGTHDLVFNQGKKECTVCKKQVDYTDEENFALWKIGRDYSLSCEDNYTFDFEKLVYQNNTLIGKSTEVEALSGDKFYYELADYEVDTSNNMQVWKD